MPLLILTVCSLFAFLMDKPAFYGGGIGGALFSSIWSYFCYKNYPKKMAKEIEQKEVQNNMKTYLSSQDSVKERFEPNFISRGLVRLTSMISKIQLKTD